MAALHCSQPTLQTQAGPGPAGGQVCVPGPQEGFTPFYSKLWGWVLWLWPGSTERVALVAAVQNDR